MALSVKHKFVSGKGDGTDSTRVRPSNWNDEHDMKTEVDGVVLGRPAGAGPGDVQEVAMSALFPAGITLPYGGATPPAGWLLCNGQSLLRSEYPALFNAIGTAYGQGVAPGSTFAAPDCRGRTIVGPDGGTGRLPGWVLGTAGGAYGAQPRVYGNVYGETGSFSIGGTTGHNSHSTTVSGPEGHDTDVAAHVHNHSWGQTLNLGISSTIVNNGNNVTDYFAVVQPSIAMNMIIKT